MKTAIFTRPAGRSTPNPPRTTAAPARPPMSACDDDTGSPSHQVRRFQVMAPTRPPRTTQRSTAAGSTTPLPRVLATLTPNPNAATKLKNAAQATATLGDNVPVETTVATELAASWKPFRKSKTSATTMMPMTEIRRESMAGSTAIAGTELLVLQDDAFEDDGDVLPAVRRGLHCLDDFLGLDDEDRVAPRIENARDRLAVQAIPLLLERVDAGAVLQHRLGVAQVRDRPLDLDGLSVNDPRQVRRVRDLSPQSIQHDATGGRIDTVHEVVHAGG